jgi:glycosyltransferase involved in cell wall biosynthesis
MAAVLTTLLVIAAALILIIIAVFLTEVVASVVLSWRHHPSEGEFGDDVKLRVGVIVPAHNESLGMRPTLCDIKGQLGTGDRLLVIADNCTDDTASVALGEGAEVIERKDLRRRGKGYALDCGLQYLSSAPPDILIMVDADCRVANGTIDALIKTCAAADRPVQALYLMTPPPEAQINQRVAEFAWRVKNWLRPAGLAALRLPCQLMGTGMAFPWVLLSSVDLASGSIVEDLKLGLDLTANGHPPIFCPSALVTSQFASTAEASRTQRERWEGGHIATILAAIPRLFCKAVARRDLNLLVLTLDLMVPPLSLLALFIITMLLATFVWAAFGFSSLPFSLSAASFLAFLLAGVLGWLKCGSDILPISQLPSVLVYIWKKLGLYRAILFGKTPRSWTRTER